MIISSATINNCIQDNIIHKQAKMVGQKSISKSLLQRFIAATLVSASSVAAFSGHVQRQTVPTTKQLNQCSLQWQHSRVHHRCAGSPIVCKSSSSEDETPAPHLTRADIEYMNHAATHARIGYGNTFPNPAVGCVLVRRGEDDENKDTTILGSGFHPKAGLPHAEVFALFEACGHVNDGVAAAKSVMGLAKDGYDNESLSDKVQELLSIYKSEDGASKLFNGYFDDQDVTAYVTLEPCCHVGQTPPCALSLVAAGINRVVVGYRDPNPRVDGGGIKVLQDANVEVHILDESSSFSDQQKAAKVCSNLVKSFVNRISPREEPVQSLDEMINGKMRRALRSIAGRQKSDGTIKEVDWPRDFSVTLEDKKSVEFAESVPISHRFLERVDEFLWDQEIVLLRLNNVVQKKKGAKIVGGRIAEELNAHLAQVIGHTALLYRPGFPPVLDLEELIKEVDVAE